MDIFLGKYTIGYTLDMGIYQQYWGYIGHIIVLYWTIVDIYIYWIWEYTDDILLLLGYTIGYCILIY